MAATAMPALAGLGVMAAYYRFLRETDELLRSIQLNGLAVGFGAGIFWSVLGSMIARTGWTTPEVLSVSMVMFGAYAIGVTITAHRHGAMD